MIFRNNVTNRPVKRGSVSVINSKGSLSTLPDFNSSATNPTIKFVTETKSSANSASNSQEDTTNKSSITSTNNIWVKNFIESSLDIIVLEYVDYCIIFSRDKRSIASFIDNLTHGPERFVFTDEGSMDKYLSVDIEGLPDNSGFSMNEPYLIERILGAANIELIMTNYRPTPAVGTLLTRDED